MIAIIFHRSQPDTELGEMDGELLDHFQGLSTTDWVVELLGAAIAWALLAWIIRRLFSRMVERRDHTPPTNTLTESAAGLLLFLLLGQLVASALKILGITREGPDAQAGIILGFAATACALGVSVLVLRIVSGERQPGTFQWWGMRREGFVRTFLVVPLSLVAFAPLNVSVLLLWRYLLHALHLDTQPQPVLVEPIKQGGPALPVVFVLAVTAVPILEEILFRGALYRALREHVGPVAGAVISAVLFAACHFNLASFVPILVLALFLAFAYEWTGSLWAPILVHAWFNVLNFTLA